MDWYDLCIGMWQLFSCNASVWIDFCFPAANFRKRLNYVNHARRLAEGDWTGADSDGEEDMENKEEGEQKQDDNSEEEGMEIERRKLPKHYANQVSLWCM